MDPVRKWIIIVVVAVIALGVAGYIAASRSVESDGVRASGESAAYAVGRSTLTRTVSASGRLEPSRRRDLPAATSGRVVAVHREPGDPVEAGDPILELDSTAARLDLIQAERAYEEAKVDSPPSLLEEARLVLETARSAFEATMIRAPFDGVVADLPVKVGDSVGEKSVVATVIDPDHYEITVELDQLDLQYVTLGQSVEVRLDAFPGAAFKGRVSHIGWMPSDASGVVVFPVNIALEPAEVPLRPGLSAEVAIVVEQAANALIIPMDALHEAAGGLEVVRIRADGGRERVPVVTGVSDGRWVEIVEGLAEGDRIVASDYARYQILAEEADEEAGRSGVGRSPFGATPGIRVGPGGRIF